MIDLHKYCYKAQCESYVYTVNASKIQRSGPRVYITNPRTDECFVRTSFSNPQRFFFFPTDPDPHSKMWLRIKI